MSVKVDTQGDLWISPYGKGLDRYIDGGRKQTHYDVSNSDLTNNVILDIEERDGSLWLGTAGGGNRIPQIIELERRDFFQYSIYAR